MKLKVIVWLAVMFWLPSLASGQDLEPQTWLGELDVKVAKLRLEVRVKSAEDGSIKAQMFSLDQNNAEIPVDSFVLDGQSVAMKMESVGASFEGELSEDGLECVGTFAQGGQEFPLVFKKVDKVPERKHVANWAGTLKAGGQEFEFQLRVFEDDDGKQSAVLDSFSESIQGLSTEYVQDGNDFRFDVPLSAGKFVGVLNADRTKVVGKWIQGGGEYDLEFDSVALEDTRKLERKRPQTPKPPFDYDVTELSITNDAANVELHGTLTTPKGRGPFRTVVLVSGSGPQDRDETIVGHKPFAVLADHLTRAGLAVFRFDDRGVGESTGDFSSATTEDFASDVLAIVKSLRKQEKVREDQVGIIGHSEGGLIAPLVAVSDPKLSFIVLMAGPGVSGREILLKQSREIAEAGGAPKDALDLNEKLLTLMLDKVTPENKETDILDRVVEELKATMNEEERKLFSLPDAARAQMNQFESPWFRFFNVYDPAPTLEQVDCRVLSVIGEKDLQVDCEVNQAAVEAALKKGGNLNYQIEKLPNLNHMFQECETGSPSEYGSIEETLNPAFLDLVTAWILK